MVTHWFSSDEATLIKFLVARKAAEVGNGFNFKGVS
jgi:hypothetical protein